MFVSAADAVITAVMKSLLTEMNVMSVMAPEFVLIAGEAEEFIKINIPCLTATSIIS